MQRLKRRLTECLRCSAVVISAVVPAVLAVLAMLAVLAVPGPALAQSDGFALTGVSFNFTNPGARARGIGGAFVAIADDSTAAIANPAGLAYLQRELTIEGISDEERVPVGQLTQGGIEVESVPLGEVVTPLADPFRVRAASRSRRLNYASLLLPVQRFRLTLGFYYATLADIEADLEVGPGVLCVRGDGSVSLPGAGEPCRFDFLDPTAEAPDIYFGQQVSYSLQTRLYGAAVGYRVSDTVAVGAGVAAARTTFDGRALQLREAYGSDDVVQTTRVDDTDLVYSLGVLYRGDRLGLGLCYRSEAIHPTKNAWLDTAGEPLPNRTAPVGTLAVPERLAAGIALFPADAWVVSAEVDWISYSDVLAGMQPFNPTARADAADVRYQISDVEEYHLGVEYSTFAQRRGWSVRLGYWRDRTHLPWVQERWSDPSDPDDALRARESLVRARFDDAVDHLTAGFGISGPHARLDLALDHTDDAGVDVLLSTVLYF